MCMNMISSISVRIITSCAMIIISSSSSSFMVIMIIYHHRRGARAPWPAETRNSTSDLRNI